MKVIKRGCSISEQDLVSIGEIIELHDYSTESPVKVIAMAKIPNVQVCSDCCLSTLKSCKVQVKMKHGMIIKVQLCWLKDSPIFCIFKKVDELLEDL